MARLSTRLSRYFSLRSSPPAQKPKINKLEISKPITPSEEDTHPLTTSSQSPTSPHAHSHSHSSSSSTSNYSISDQDLRRMEDSHLSRGLSRGVNNDIDNDMDSDMDNDIDDILAIYHYPDTCKSTCANTPFSADIHIAFASPTTVPTLRAKLETFENTPPPAPSYAKLTFGKEVGFSPRREMRQGPFSPAGRGGKRRGYDVLG